MELNSISIEVSRSTPMNTEEVRSDVKRFIKIRHKKPEGLSQTQIQQLHKLKQSLTQEEPDSNRLLL